MSRSLPWLLLLGLAACVEGGRSLRLGDDAALSWFVRMDGSRVEISPTLRGEAQPAVAIAEDVELFLLRLGTEALVGAAPDLDLERLEAVELVAGAAVDESCEAGELERSPNAAHALRLSAAAVATLYGLGESSLSGPIEAWPAPLRGLALRVPLREPCAPMAGRVTPFADRERLFEFGEVLAGRTLAPGDVGATDARGAAYLDDDHVLLALPELLLILRRGQAHVDGLKRVVTGLEFLRTPAEDQYWSLRDVAVVRSDAMRHQAYAVVQLQQRVGPNEGYYAGLGIADFVVTSTSISAGRLRYFQPVARLERDPPKLDDVATDDAGGFAAVGDKLVVWGDAEGEVRFAEPQAINGGSVLFAAPPLPRVLIQDKRGGWWTGDLEPEPRLTWEPRSAVLMLSGETDGTMRTMPRGPDTRVLSGNELGELWERHGGRGWQQHRWWLPPTAAACAAGRPRCGRLEPRGFGPMSDFEVEGEAVLHTFRNCDFLFRTRPSENRCSEHLELRFDEYRLPDDTPSVNYATRRGRRMLFAGDGGLLVELDLD